MIAMRLARSRHFGLLASFAAAASFCACSAEDDAGGPTPAPDASAGATGESGAPDAALDQSQGGAGADADASDAVEASGPCPADMALVEGTCIDRFEAPNQAGALPLVMYSFDESAAWCAARSKRLCFDDEWTRSCAGSAGNKYPYGNALSPGTCNDDKSWLLYDQSKLNGWPWNVSKPDVESLADLLDAARAVSASAQVAADHVEALYQAEGSGSNTACAGQDAVYDLTGNVEEWTRRRDGGEGPSFSGALKGRYWAEPRTCQSAVLTHGNGFRFYEIGFRCCRDAAADD
jgi:formylglycine-generating enzyme required for sulfatase activity